MSSSLNFDSFVSKINNVFENLTDNRMFSPNLQYSVKDAALGAFSVFFSQSPSFLSHQRQRHQSQGKDNAQTLFEIEQIPSDPQIRNLLDPVAPGELHSVFSETFEELEQQGYLQEYRFFADYRLMALDRTDYFSSSKISCDNCSTKHHKNGKVSYSHKVLTPVVVAPKNSKVIVLEPEFLTPQDGSEKQDCELNAAKRWIEKHSHLASKQIIILGDELFSRNPFCQLLLEKVLLLSWFVSLILTKLFMKGSRRGKKAMS
ncbi:hypothetical protein WDW89_11415 [Deltaproteobacteria bacterium TL4]